MNSTDPGSPEQCNAIGMALPEGVIFGTTQLWKTCSRWRLEILIRSLVRRMFRVFGRLFEAIGADDGVSRRDECISTGRVRPGSSPRGAGDMQMAMQ